MKQDESIARAFSLAGKVAVVTGAASGIGQEAARILSLAGAKVYATDIDEAALQDTGAAVGASGGACVLRRVDVSRKEEMEALADAVMAETGQLDVWVNNAGIAPLHALLETDPETARHTVGVNMLGTYWGCMAAGRVMGGAGGGAIINISSAGGAKPVPNLAIYGMTKAAVNSLTWTAATELGPLGIRVNAIAPGWIETPAFAALCRNEAGEFDPAMREGILADMAAASPLGRVGKVTDIAYALVYLASEAGSFVTGQVLRVNGGESM